MERRGSALTATALCALLTSVISVIAQQSAEPNALEQEPYGFFAPIGKRPKPFADITELHLSGAGEYGVQAKPPYLGVLKTGGKTPAGFKLRQRAITGRKLTFATEEVRQISYSFEGMLARSDFHSGGVPLHEPMLTGKIKKLDAGNEVAAADLQFVFEGSG